MADKKLSEFMNKGNNAAGSNGQIQFNDDGASGADTNLTWDNTNKRLGINNPTPSTELDVHSTKTTTPTKVDVRNKFTGQNLSGDDYEVGTINLGCDGFNASISAKLPNGAWGDGVRLDLATPIGSNDNKQIPRISIMPFTGNVGVNETNATEGKLVVKGTTTDGSTKILVGKDSAGTSVFSVDSKGNVSAANLGNWESYVPTISGVTSNPTLGTHTLNALYKVIGKTLHIKFSFRQTTAGVPGNGIYLVSIPSGYTIDTTLAPIESAIMTNGVNAVFQSLVYPPLGFGMMNYGGTATNGSVAVFTSTSTTISVLAQYANGTPYQLSWSSGWYTLSGGVYLTFEAEIPIV